MNNSLITPNTTIIIGLSGGADSVYLLHQLIAQRLEKNLTLIAAHLDHEWRTQSGNDAQFCKKLCTELQVECVVKKASQLNFTPEKTGSKEDIGRQLRRFFFEFIRQEYNATAIVLAHHQDDQIETFFIRLMRGSTIEGLTGIKTRSGYYIRPLLTTSKQEILSYLNTHNLHYVEDASNQSDEHLRNRIRNNALPVLEECDARFKAKCLDTISHIQEAQIFLEEHSQEIYKSIGYFDRTKNGYVLDATKLTMLNLYLQKRIIQKWLIEYKVEFSPSNTFLEEILRFVGSKKGGSHQLGTSWKIIKKQSKLWIEFL